MKTRIKKISLQGFKSFRKRVSIPLFPGFVVFCGPNGVGKSSRKDVEVLLSNGETRKIGELVNTAIDESTNVSRMEDGIYTIENPEEVRILGLDPGTMKIVEKDINAFIKREGEDHLIKIKTRSGKEVVTTECHPVMIFKDGKIRATKVGELKKGELIATPKKLDFNNHELVPLLTTKIDPSPGSKKIRIPEMVNEELAKFLGYFVGDGNLERGYCKFTNGEKTLLRDFIYTGQKSFSIKPKTYEYKRRNAFDVIFFSSVLSTFLNRLFKGKIRCKEKFVPSMIMVSSDKIIAHFLAALFDCDAYARKDAAGIEYSTRSERLAHQVQFLLLRLGIVSRIKPKMRRATNSKQKKEKYYYVYIGGIENLRKFHENVPLLSPDMIERIESHLNKKIKPQRHLEDILPKEVNKVTKEIVKLLGLQIKN